MDPVVRYYLRQAGRGRDNGIGPVYAAPLLLQGSTEVVAFWAVLVS